MSTRNAVFSFTKGVIRGYMGGGSGQRFGKPTAPVSDEELKAVFESMGISGSRDTRVNVADLQGVQNILDEHTRNDVKVANLQTTTKTIGDDVKMRFRNVKKDGSGLDQINTNFQAINNELGLVQENFSILNRAITQLRGNVNATVRNMSVEVDRSFKKIDTRFQIIQQRILRLESKNEGSDQYKASTVSSLSSLSKNAAESAPRPVTPSSGVGVGDVVGTGLKVAGAAAVGKTALDVAKGRSTMATLKRLITKIGWRRAASILAKRGVTMAVGGLLGPIGWAALAAFSAYEIYEIISELEQEAGEGNSHRDIDKEVKEVEQKLKPKPDAGKFYPRGRPTAEPGPTTQKPQPALPPSAYGPQQNRTTFGNNFDRQMIEREKGQFLKFGELPAGFEFLPGNRGMLGNPAAVAATGAMPLSGSYSGGGYGIPGGSFGGGGGYSGGGGYGGSGGSSPGVSPSPGGGGGSSKPFTGSQQEAFNKVYQAAVEAGSPDPRLTASIAMLESGWMKSSMTGRANNPFGQTITRSQIGTNGIVDGTVGADGQLHAVYPDLKSAMAHHLKKWGHLYVANDPQKSLANLRYRGGYNTENPAWAGQIGSIYKRYNQAAETQTSPVTPEKGGDPTKGFGPTLEDAAKSKNLMPSTGYTHSVTGKMWHDGHGNTSQFGYGRGRLHAGVDIYATDPETGKLKVGDQAPVNAPANGTIVDLRVNRGRAGNYLVFKDENGFEHRFLHTANTPAINPETGKPWKIGDTVKQGQQVTTITGSGTQFGATASRMGLQGAVDYYDKKGWGDVNKPHVHHEVRKNGSLINPKTGQPYINELYPEYGEAGTNRRGYHSSKDEMFYSGETGPSMPMIMPNTSTQDVLDGVKKNQAEPKTPLSGFTPYGPLEKQGIAAAIGGVSFNPNLLKDQEAYGQYSGLTKKIQIDPGGTHVQSTTQHEAGHAFANFVFNQLKDKPLHLLTKEERDFLSFYADNSRYSEGVDNEELRQRLTDVLRNDPMMTQRGEEMLGKGAANAFLDEYDPDNVLNLDQQEKLLSDPRLKPFVGGFISNIQKNQEFLQARASGNPWDLPFSKENYMAALQQTPAQRQNVAPGSAPVMLEPPPTEAFPIPSRGMMGTPSGMSARIDKDTGVPGVSIENKAPEPTPNDLGMTGEAVTPGLERMLPPPEEPTPPPPPENPVDTAVESGAAAGDEGMQGAVKEKARRADGSGDNGGTASNDAPTNDFSGRNGPETQQSEPGSGGYGNCGRCFI